MYLQEFYLLNPQSYILAFKITQKIKPFAIQDKSIDMAFVGKHLKGIQKTLITKTSPETPVDYYFCNAFSGADDLFVFGTQAPAYKKIFKETAKGKHGFEKEKVSIGKCYVINENQKNILCIQHNKAFSKGKKAIILRSFRKMLRSSLKQIKEVRWVENIIQEAEQNNTAPQGNTSSDAGNSNMILISPKEIEARGKQLKTGINRLKKVIKRYKEQRTKPDDAEFVSKLISAANVWISQLTQTDEKTAEALEQQRADLEKKLPQWKELEEKISNAKPREELRAELKQTIQELNIKRTRIKELLKKVNLKAALS